jgi:predicted nucleic acid-binding protein
LNKLVLDASVAVKWAIPSAREPFTDAAMRLLKRYAAGEIEFIVPDVFWAEMGNVLWKGVRQGRWRQDAAEAVAADMQARDFPTTSSLTLLSEALRIAFAHDRAVYDCLYVALAVQSKADLVTADERLANALAGRFPVKWVGAFPLS